MRRLLDWLVVSISLLLLFANRMVADRDADRGAERQADAPAIRIAASSPFAYVLADGSLLPVPVDGRTGLARSIGVEAVLTTADLGKPSELEPAVYLWSTPAPRVTSASPSLQ